MRREKAIDNLCCIADLVLNSPQIVSETVEFVVNELSGPTVSEVLTFCKERYEHNLKYCQEDEFNRGAANAYWTLMQRFGERDKA